MAMNTKIKCHDMDILSRKLNIDGIYFAIGTGKKGTECA